MSCRTGPLRVGRPLRGVYTGLGRIILKGLRVAQDTIPANGRASNPFHHDKVYPPRSGRSPRRRPVRQDTIVLTFKLGDSRGAS